MRDKHPCSMPERGGRLAELAETIAALSHELIQPLSAISLTVQSLQFSLDNSLRIPDSELRSSLALAMEQVDHLSSLINHVRSYCDGVLSENAETVDINLIAERSMLLFATQLRNHGIEVSRHLCEERLQVTANPYAIEDCVLLLARLIRNAIKRDMRQRSDHAAAASLSVKRCHQGLHGLIEVGASSAWLPGHDDPDGGATMAWIKEVVERHGGKVGTRGDTEWTYASITLPLT